jgi:hypothetical protein
VDVENVGDTTRHTGSEVATSRAKDKDTATGHVLATVVTNTLDNGGSTRVTDTETLGCNTAEEASTLSSTVQTDITNQDILFGTVDCSARWVDDQATTGQTLTDVVVGVTLELKGDTRGKVSTEGLTCGTTDVDVDGILGQTSLAITPADLVGERSTKSTVGVDNIALNAGGQTFLKSKLGLGDKLVVETDVQTMILFAHVEGSNTRAEGVCRSQDQGQIDVLGLSSAEVITDAKDLAVTNHVVDGPEAKLGHDGTELVSNVVEEVNDVLGCTGELLSELRVLGSDTDRASVQAIMR